VKAIDFHVHLPTPEWLDVSLEGYVEAAERYFRSKVARNTLEGLAREYTDLDLKAVLLAWDAETATHRPRLSNEFVAQAVKNYPEVFIGFASVDPNKGVKAVRELETAAELGLVGAKFHPSLQAFDPTDEKFWPIFAKCAELGFPCIFHTGTSGIGAGTPGGQGIRIDLCRPILLDKLAAAMPRLTIIAAHMGWPWHVELLAMAMHKTNIWIDTSGWAPRYIPPEVLRELKTRLQDQFLFGSDYPFIQPRRCLEEMAGLDIPQPVLDKLFIGNGSRLLGLG
jgi:predicted TIM-barrel fold metal-dependent hydrolase